MNIFSRLFKRQETSTQRASNKELKNEGAVGTAATENPKFRNLSPAETVPKSDEWKCITCGEGGILDFELSLEARRKYFGFRHHVAVKLYKAMLRESMAGKELRKRFINSINDSQLDGRETIRFFTEGEKFAECPNCGPATGWTILELADDIVREHRGAGYQAEDPQLQIYGPELRDLRDSIRNNRN